MTHVTHWDVGTAPQPAPIRILVVEDEALIRHDIAEALHSLGVCVIEAATADEAWDYLRSDGSVDLVFTDHRMPGSMTGAELAARIRAHYPHLQVVVTSAYFDAAGRSETIVPKPYRVAAIAAALAERAVKSRQ